MSRTPRPWYRKDRKAWFVTIDGERHNLGSDRVDAHKQFHEMMAKPEKPVVRSGLVVELLDRFLTWVEKNRSIDTYIWYQSRLQLFAEKYPDLCFDDLKPFHVQEWIDEFDLSNGSKRNYARSVVRCMNWCEEAKVSSPQPVAGKAFGFSAGQIFLSEDNCRTWAHSAAFPDAENITFSCILKNGNILFATREKLFLSTDNLKTHRQITVKDRGGRDYLPHTPVNPDQPGWYFHPLDGEHTWDVNGTEMLVWGNYCNVTGGPVPVNVYYSTDSGQTVKIAYSFGVNPHFQQKGATPGTPLGDAANPLIARHIHGLAYNPVENAFYTCTGDINRGNGNECHWLRGTYDAQTDTWDWIVLVSVNSDSRFKSGGINIVDGRLYWVADANGPNAGANHDRGVFTCGPEDISNKAAHKLLFNLEFESANMIVQDGVMLAALYAPASTFACGFVYSPDLGKTWAKYDLKEFGPRSGVRFQKKNSDGWFRVDLRKGWIDRAEVLFIKPKP